MAADYLAAPIVADVRRACWIDSRWQHSSPCRLSPRLSQIIVERRKRASRCYSRSTRIIGLSVVHPPSSFRLGAPSRRKLLPHRQCHTIRPPALESRLSRFGAVGAPVSDEATLVIARFARRRSIRRNYCRLRPPQSSRALAIWSKWSRVREPAVGDAALPPTRQSSSNLASRDKIAPTRPPKMRSSIRWDSADYCPCRLRVVRESRTVTVVMHLVRFSCLLIVTLVSLLLHCRRPTPHSRVCHLRSFLSRYCLTCQCLRRCRNCGSRTNPTRHSLPRRCRCRARYHRCCHLLLNRIWMPLLESPGTPRIERHCWKPHRDSASQRHRVSK